MISYIAARWTTSRLPGMPFLLSRSVDVGRTPTSSRGFCLRQLPSLMAVLLFALVVLPGQVLAVTASPTSIARSITEDNTPTPFGNIAISATTLNFPFETFLGWTVSVAPTRGTVSFASAGSKNTTVTYTCTVPNYVGSDSFTILCQGNYGNDTIPVTVTISQVNDPPTFTLGSGHTTNEDSGAQAVAGFATGFNPGNAYESAQSLSNYTVTTDDGSLFSSLPAINTAGTLTYTPAPNRAGTTTIRVRAVDNGGTTNGGINTSSELTATITINPVSDGRLYATVAGGGNGLSWGSPFTLKQAMDYSTSGEDIWVAAGTHTPGSSRSDAFQLKAGVTVYGGFTGSETLLSQRDIRANITIMSGDIGSIGVQTDNSYNVIEALESGTLDGFRIQNGYANGSGTEGEGGGMYIAASPTVRDCQFISNTCPGFVGGAISIRGTSFVPVFNRCVFISNSATYGGAVYTNGGGDFINCVFQSNSASTEGGAIRTSAGGSPTSFNCTFVQNTSPAASGAVHPYGNFAVTNCIFWSNTTYPLASTGGGTRTASNCLIQNGDLGGFTNLGGLVTTDPQFFSISDGDGADNRWGTGDDGLFPRATSPARDAGTDAGAPVVDIRVSPRPSGLKSDIGAYERRVYHVTTTGVGTGETWAAASSNLVGILAAAQTSDEVWVRAGVYRASSGTDETATFAISAGVGLYGGFAGGETALSARDWTVNRTTLSGDLGGGNRTRNIVSISGTGSQVDGFIIRDAAADAGSAPGNAGGGIRVTATTAVIQNCVITDNGASYAGGGLFFAGNGSMQVHNCLFLNNSASTSGGGIAMENGTNSAYTYISNSTFVGNSAPNGSAFENHGLTYPPLLVNCLMWGNTGGQAIYCPSGTAPETYYSLVQGSGGGTWAGGTWGNSGGGNVDANPQFFNQADPDGADNLFFSTDDGLVLLTGSPAANSALSWGLMPNQDIRRQPRPTGAAPDMGCYEGQVGRVSFSTSTANVSEGAGTTNVSVALAAAADFPVTVNYAVTGGTAINGVGVGTGVGIWDFPLYTYFHDARTTSIYLSSELGGAATFRSLVLDVTQVPLLTMNSFTVRMKHTALAAFATADWGVTTGWDTVYSGNLTVTSTGPLVLNFNQGDSAFVFDGAQNVLVDISFNNSTWTDPRGYVRVSTPGGNRSLYYNTDSGFGDPLTWTGTTNPPPIFSANVPNIKFATDAGGGMPDYRLASGSVTIPVGSTSASIPVTILQDALDEVDETVIITLSGPTHAVLATPTTHTLTILDDDAAPTVQFAASTGSGAESVSSPAVAVTLSTQSAKTVTVTHSYDGTSTARNADPQRDVNALASGVLTFTPGITSATIPSFSVVNTPVYDEDSETAVFKLSSPGNATLGSVTTHTYTITDTDTSAVQLSESSLSVTESSATPDTFTVVLATRPYIPSPVGDAVVRVDFTIGDSTEAVVSADGTTYASSVSVWFSSAGVGSGLSSGNPAAYGSPLTIRVRSVDDDIDDGPVGSTLTVSTANASTTDTRYAGLANQFISITTNDDIDAAGFVVEPLQSPVPGGIPPLPLAESWFSRQITAIDGTRTVLTVTDVSGVAVGMRTYNYVDGTYGFVAAVNGGAQQVTLSSALGATDPVGNDMAFGFENVYVVKLATEPTGSVRLTVDPEDSGRFYAYFPDTDILDASNWDTGIQVIAYAFNNSTFEADATFDVILKVLSTGAAEYVDVEPSDPEVIIINDDVRGVSITPGTLSVTEGGISQIYSVALTSEPVGGSVTITPTPGNAQATVSTDLGATLVFTAANWYLTQNVYVTAVDDDDYDPSASCVISHGVSGADYGSVTAGDVTVTVDDNESLAPIISPSSGLVTSEGSPGGTATFTIRLAAQPAVGEIITIGPLSVVNDSSPETEATVTTGGTIYFARTAQNTGDGYSAVNASAWSDPVTVELTGGPDNGADGDQIYDVVIPTMASSLGGGSPFNGFDVADVVDCINTDNAVAGVVVTGGTLGVTEGGSTKDYTLKLTWNPTTPPLGNYVLVSITSADPGEVTVSPNLVLFTGPFGTDAATYNLTPSNIKTITVTAVDDSIDETSEVVAINHAVVLSDDSTAQFTTGLSINSAQATVTDNDVAGVELLAPAQVTTSEAGGTANFTVRLKTQPTAHVTIGLSLSGDTDEVRMTTVAEPAQAATKTLTFTTSTWSTPQTVTVVGQNDFLDDGDRSFTVVTGATASGDAFYSGISVPDVDGLNLDNDAVGVTVSKSTVSVVEGGATESYALSLTSEPTGTVTVALAGSGQVGFEVGATSVTAVYFAAAAAGTGDGSSAANARLWSSPLTLVVRAVDDQIDEATSHQATITHAVSGADYAGVVASSVTATITDNAGTVAGITVTPNLGALGEGGASGSIGLVLASKPTGNVRIAVTSSNIDVATVSPALVTFTPSNWSVAQNIAVTPIDDLVDQDTDGTQGNADDVRTSSLSFVVTSFDPAYDARVVAPVVASVADEDIAGVTVTPLAGMVVSEDGDTADFTVVLDREPLGDVTIPLTTSDSQRASISVSSLTFTPANWSIAQTVTITGQDLDGVHDTGVSPPVTIQTGDPQSTVATEAFHLLDAGDVGDPTVTVQGSNAAPRIASIPDVVLVEATAATPVALPAFNVDSGQAGESQSLAISVNSSNPTLFPTISAALAGAPAMPTDQPIAATVTVTPAPFLSGTATVTVTVIDDTSIATDAVARQTIAVFTVTVTAVNNAPEVTIPVGTTPEHTEGGSATPILTSLTVTDVDNSTLTSATVTITNPLDGDLEILQATVGGTAIVAFYDTAARVLYLNSGTPRPLSEYQQVLRTVAYRNADDDPTTGVGTSRVLQVVVSDGTSDSVAATAPVDVLATNDPPVLSGTVEPFPDIDEDEVASSGFAVDDLIGGGVQLVDPDSLTLGVAVDDTSGTPTGTWQYTLNGGGAWTDFPDLTGDLHLVLSADGSGQNRIRFVPDGDENGTVFLGWRAWDRFDALASGANPSVIGVGTSPSAYSSAVLVAPLVIQAVNDAPVLAGPGTLTDVDEDSSVHDGDSVETLLSARVTDIDAGAVDGIAVTALGSDGTWQYSLDDGSNWFAFPAVTPATATVLRANGNLVRIRFVPDADFNGTSSITYRAWDASDGNPSGTANVDASATGGITPFSSVAITDIVTVLPVNDAPVLNGVSGSSTIDSIVEDIADGANVGVSVTAILAELSTTDVDTAALGGIAVVGADGANGTWQYDIGGGWIPFGGGLSEASARLLADGAGNLIRFVPDADFVGTATITIRLWDQTGSPVNGDVANVSINGGTTAYSTASEAMQVVVTAINDAPTVDLNGPAVGVDMVTPAVFTEGASAQFVHIAGVSVTDPDSTTLTGGTIVLTNPLDGADEVIAVNAAGLSMSAVWNPGTWTITLSGSAPLSEYQQLLTSLTYHNASEDPDGSADRSITVILSDGALSSPVATGLVQVQPVNDPPQVTTNTGVTVLLRGDTAIDEVGPAVIRLQASDVDSPAGSIFYTISLQTGVGTLYLDTGTTSGALDGTDTVLSVGETFTQTDLLAGLVRYIHGGSGASDGFAFTVSDGVTASSVNVFAITIDRSPPDIVMDPTMVGALDFTEGDPALKIAPLGTVSDDDSADFNGGVLTITIQGGVGSDETLDVDLTGDISVTGSSVAHLGTAFATLVSGRVAGQDLVLSFNGNATDVRVQGFLQSVTYLQVSDAPTPGARVMQAVMSDGDGDTSVPATRSITLIPVNDPPTIAAGSLITPKGVAYITDLIVGDVDSYPLTLDVITTPGKGVLTGAIDSSASTNLASALSSRTFTYTPTPGQEGADSFVVRVTDAGGATAQATFSVIIIGGATARPWIVSDPPVEAEAGAPLTYDIVTDFSDLAVPPAPGDVTYSLVGTLPAGVTLGGFTPSGTDATLTFTVGAGATGVIEVIIVVSESANSTTGYQPITVVIVPAGALGG